MTAVTREVLDAIRDKRIPQADTELFATFRPWKRTDAEIAALVTPVNYAFEPYTSPRHAVLADNSTDDSMKLQALLDSAVAASNGSGGATRVRVNTSGLGTIYCLNALTYDCSKVGADWGGAYTNFEDHANAAFSAVKITTSQQDAALGALSHNVRGLENIVIQMPDRAAVNNGEALRLEDVTASAGSYVLACASLRNISIHGGAFGLVFGNGSWGANIYSFVATSQGTNALGTAIYAPSPWTDGQEASKIFGGLISNCQSAITLRLGSVYLFGMNLDGCANVGTLENDGLLRFSGCYSEFIEGDNAQFKFDANDSNARMEILDVEFNVRSDLLASRTKSFGRNNGVVYLRNLNILDGGGVGSHANWFATPFLFEGTGRMRARDLRYTNLSPVPLGQKGFNWLAYPDCNNANVLAAFTLSNSTGVNPVRATGVVGRDAVRFQINNGAASGSFSRAVLTHACSTGQRICAVGEYEGSLAGSNTTPEVTFTYQDKAGNTLTTSTVTLPGTSSGAWAIFMADAGYAPAGSETVAVQLQLRATGVVAGNTFYHMSPLDIGDAGSCG